MIRGHGFWFGCQLNFKYLFSLWVLTSTVSCIAYFAATRGGQKHVLRKIDNTTLYKNIFFTIAMCAFAVVFVQTSESIAKTESAYQDAISAVLLVVGMANLLLQALVLEIFIFRFELKGQTHTEPSATRVHITQASNFFHMNLGPVIVISCFFYFVMRLLEVKEDGLAGLFEQKEILIGFVISYLVWLISFIALSNIKTQNIITSLNALSNQISRFSSGAKLSLLNLGPFESVAHGLNQSLEILQQRILLIQNFSKFVSDKLLETIVLSDSQSLQGLKTNCVVIMTDLRDFTTVSNQLNPEDVVKLLNIYFQDMIYVLNTHGICIDKFIGDGLLAYIPIENESQRTSVCESALKSVIGMISQMKETNGKLTEMNLPPMKIGAGIHLGEVILGAMGSQTRMQYTIIGDTVNRAARLEGLCKSLDSDIVVSKPVFDSLSDDLKSTLDGSSEVQMKGISSKELVYHRSSQKVLKSA